MKLLRNLFLRLKWQFEYYRNGGLYLYFVTLERYKDGRSIFEMYKVWAPCMKIARVKFNNHMQDLTPYRAGQEIWQVVSIIRADGGEAISKGCEPYEKGVPDVQQL
jgi:hypothetical protein